jgi:transposase
MEVRMVRNGRPKAPLVLTEKERETLTRWARRPKSAQRLALRCRIVLACAEGSSNREVAAALGVAEVTVGKWRSRFVAKRLDGLVDEPRPGVPRSVTDDMVEAVIVKTLEEVPADATHWSTRSMATKAGMSRSTVSRIWRAFGLKPHLVDTFKLSTDPMFIDKIRDLVGLYMNPPDHAAVFCIDEKTQVQALDRTQPILPLLPGVPQRQSHDYKRNGTIDLYAALNLATGEILHQLTPQHRAIEFKKFLLQIDKAVPRRPGHPCRDRQRLDPQDAGHPELACASPPIPLSLHAHLELMDEPRRTLVRRTHREMASARHALQRQRTCQFHYRLGQYLEHEPPPLRLAQDSGRDHRLARPILPTNL